VSKGGLGDRSLDIAHTPAKRAAVPPDQLCGEEANWRQRICVTEEDDRAWMDVCLAGDYYFEHSTCPLHTMCMNVLGPGPEHVFISICLERPSGLINTGLKQQMGEYTVSSPISLGPVFRTVEVAISNALSMASVSAYLEGTDGNYILAAKTDLVGSLRRTTKKPCTYNQTNRDCVPTGQYNLCAGDVIDFDFGLASDEIVRFYYAINGT